jgi:hypothetical protein
MKHPRPHTERLPGEGSRQQDRDHGRPGDRDHGRRQDNRGGGSPGTRYRDNVPGRRRVMPEDMAAMFDRLRDAAAAHDGDMDAFSPATKPRPRTP